MGKRITKLIMPKVGYTCMSNYHMRDKRLSNKAIGLMCKMLSLPEDWDYSVSGLVFICKDGRDSINSALRELEEVGYLVRTPVKDEKNRFAGYDYELKLIPDDDPF